VREEMSMMGMAVVVFMGGLGVVGWMVRVCGSV
jgi:hypothetical protein